MANYGYVIIFSLIGGMFSLIGGVVLLSRKNIGKYSTKYITPFAAGALLGAVFLDLLEEGIENSSADSVLLATLCGVLLFFAAEKGLRWFHHNHEHADKDFNSTTGLIVVGDTIHNAMDGVAIATAFLISIPTGIVTTLAVAAHEIPQEIGDFGLLLSKGMNRVNIIKTNIASSLATTFMAVITFAIGNSDSIPVGVLLGLSSGFLLYIAMSDVIPTIHENSSHKTLLDIQILLLLAGVLVVGVSISLSHRFIH